MYPARRSVENYTYQLPYFFSVEYVSFFFLSNLVNAVQMPSESIS